MEAERLRAASLGARLLVRRQLELSRVRLAETCSTYVLLSELRSRPFPGAWSDLRWLPPDELIDVVLVPLEAASPAG
jgi:hypothetical protein